METETDIYSMIVEAHPDYVEIDISKITSHPNGGGVYDIEIIDSEDNLYNYEFDTETGSLEEVGV